MLGVSLLFITFLIVYANELTNNGTFHNLNKCDDSGSKLTMPERPIMRLDIWGFEVGEISPTYGKGWGMVGD